MSELKFSCPHCSQHIACGLDWAGMQTKCPSCQNDIVIPKPPPAVAAAPSPGPLRVSMPSSHSAAPPPPPPPPPPARSSFPQPPAASGLSVARPAAPPPQHVAADGGHAGSPPAGGRSVRVGDSPAVQWAGLIGAFLVTAIIIGMAATWKPPTDTPYMRMVKLREAAKGGTAATDEDEEEGPAAAAAVTAKAATPVAPQWSLDLQGAQIPQAAASGQFGGRAFAPERAYLQRTPTGYLLTVRQGAGFQAEREILVALPLSQGQPLDGQS